MANTGVLAIDCWALSFIFGAGVQILVQSHDSAIRHDNGAGHPEAPVRLLAIASELDKLPEEVSILRQEASEATREQLTRVHSSSHVDHILRNVPATGRFQIDADTSLSPGSGQAALRAAGGACSLVDQVLTGEHRRGFLAMRPPGHHAEPSRAMGFCLFNSIAVAAMQAREAHGCGRIVIMDFDVHHGNGTQAAFWNDPQTLYISTHQWPLYPGTGAPNETGEHNNILNALLRPGTGASVFRQLIDGVVADRIVEFAPELILVSAGFDAHAADPLAQIELEDGDFGWVTSRLVELAEEFCEGRLVSVLEGGYHPEALARSVNAHLEALAGRTAW